MDDATEAGKPADATCGASAAANAAPDTTRPERASRLASMARAVASRVATVPSGR